MDNRIVILFAAIVLMLAAFAALISSLVAARAHRRKAKVLEAELDARHAPTVLPTTKVDASFEGFNLEVVPDTPSAWLLTPLRTGDWKPPEEPAPAASLPAVSLAERVKRFDQQPPGADLASAAPETPSPERTMLLENLPDVWPVTKVVGAHVEPLAEGAAAPPVPEPEGAAADAPLVPLPVPEPDPVPVLEPEPAFVWQPPEIEPATEKPTPVVDSETVADPKSPERPKAQASAILEESGSSVAAPEAALNDAPVAPPAAPAEFVEMVAPVELWFGEYRVGVKSGSKTHEQFRKYADALLGELKGTGQRTR